MHELIPSEKITLPLIGALFAAAKLGIKVTDEGALIVINTDADLAIEIERDTQRQTLVFRSIKGFDPDSTAEARALLCNRLNENLVFARFAAIPEDLLVADYFLCYEGGVTAHQILRAYRWFISACRGSLTEFDTDGIVE